MVVSRILMASFLLLLTLASRASTGELIKCTGCGMQSELSSRFTARTIEGGKELYFCDIGDLLAYLNKKGQPGIRAEVRDYRNGAWTDASTAAYVQSPKKFNSPMGWGIAAFSDKKEATAYGGVMDKTGALKAVR